MYACLQQLIMPRSLPDSCVRNQQQPWRQVSWHHHMPYVLACIQLHACSCHVCSGPLWRYPGFQTNIVLLTESQAAALLQLFNTSCVVTTFDATVVPLILVLLLVVSSWLQLAAYATVLALLWTSFLQDIINLIEFQCGKHHAKEKDWWKS